MLYVINEDDECLSANLLRNVANYNITAWPGSADLHLLPASHGVSIEAVKETLFIIIITAAQTYRQSSSVKSSYNSSCCCWWIVVKWSKSQQIQNIEVIFPRCGYSHAGTVSQLTSNILSIVITLVWHHLSYHITPDKDTLLGRITLASGNIS